MLVKSTTDVATGHLKNRVELSPGSGRHICSILRIRPPRIRSVLVIRILEAPLKCEDPSFWKLDLGKCDLAIDLEFFLENFNFFSVEVKYVGRKDLFQRLEDMSN